MDKKILQYDLNSLKILSTLFAERSVKGTADRLCTSPSSISKTLGRMREEFNDPLFIRTAAGLVATERAKELEPLVSQLFDILGNCFTGKTFDPSSATGTIRIVSPEQFSFAFLPKLLVSIKKVAPKLCWDCHQLDGNYLEQLANGSLDFAISVENPASGDYQADRIYSSTPIYWARKNHPLKKNKGQIKLAEFLSYPQIWFRSQNLPQSEIPNLKQKLAYLGFELNPLLDTNHLFTALDVLLRTDSLLFGPDYLAQFPYFEKLFTAFELDHIPEYNLMRTRLSIIRHKRTLNSELHNWVSAEISAIFSAQL